MRKNYFEIKEINEEIRVYKIIKFDLLILINHCIQYHVEYENFKKVFLDLEKKIDEKEVIVKNLVGDKNV